MLFSPAVGPLFCHPSRCSGPQLLCLLVDSPLSLTELLASCLQHHPVWSCSLALLTPPSARCACREPRLLEILQRDIAFSSSSLAVIMALHEPPAMALHGSPASLHASPCFDKLFARPRADPRVLFRTLLQSSAALARRCAGRFAGLTSTTCVPSSHCASRPPGHDPAEALLRLSAAVAAALGHVPHGQWALLDADMPLLIDRSACLVEPVAVELLAPPVLVLSPQQARPTPRPVAARETHREASLSKVLCSSELLTLSCSCRLDALVRLIELTELTALMPSSGQSRSTCASSCRLTATLRPPFQRTPFTTVDPCRHSDCSTLFHTAQIPAEIVVA